MEKMKKRANNVPNFDSNSRFCRPPRVMEGWNFRSSRSDSSCSRKALRGSTMTLNAGSEVGMRVLWQTRCLSNHHAVLRTGVEIRSTPHCAIKSYCRRSRLRSDPQLLSILKHIKVAMVHQRHWTEHLGMALEGRAWWSAEIGGIWQTIGLQNLIYEYKSRA
jgi:hypothetical protein